MPITTSTIDQSPAIQHGHAFAALSTGHGASLNDFDAARLRTATQGIHTITALLQQRELDVEGSDAGAPFGPTVAIGLLSAIAACAELVDSIMDKAGQAARPKKCKP